MPAKRSYAVVWSNDGTTGSGRLELLRDRFELHGRERRLAIPFTDLTDASISLPVLALSRRGGPPVWIASLEGAGVLHELAARIGRAESPVAAAQSGT